MIAFLGDVALLSKEMKSEYKPAHSYVFNLEYVIGKKEDYLPFPNKINLCSENADFEGVFGKNPIAVGVINNHIMDYRKQGYENTLSVISQKGIQASKDEPCWIVDDVCLLSYMDLGENDVFSFSNSKEKIAQTIQALRAKNPNVRIVVQMHWGIENHPKQTEKQVKIAHWLIDSGADLIIGHHPHCIQPVEIYQGKYIFYSLGNALFDKIDQPSHYDEQGIPKRKYRFRWQRWNRLSLAVVYDEENNCVAQVDELYQKKGTLACRKENIPLKSIQKRYRRVFPNLRYTFRKYFLFFVSNIFADGKLFDLNALRSEAKKHG